MPDQRSNRFRELFRRNKRTLLDYFKRRVGPENASDLLQETFVRAIRRERFRQRRRPAGLSEADRHQSLARFRPPPRERGQIFRRPATRPRRSSSPPSRRTRSMRPRSWPAACWRRSRRCRPNAGRLSSCAASRISPMRRSPRAWRFPQYGGKASAAGHGALPGGARLIVPLAPDLPFCAARRVLPYESPVLETSAETMSEDDPSEAELERRRAAIAWWMRLDAGAPSTPAEREAFAAWLTADAANKAAFDDICRLWGDLEIMRPRLAPRPRRDAPQRAPAPGAAQRARRWPASLWRSPSPTTNCRSAGAPARSPEPASCAASRSRTARASSSAPIPPSRRISPAPSDASRCCEARPGSPWRPMPRGPSRSRPRRERRRRSAPPSTSRSRARAPR